MKPPAPDSRLSTLDSRLVFGHTGLSRPNARAALFLLLLFGAFFRLDGLRWEGGHHLHPDERFISMVEEKLSFPSGLAEYFDSLRSPANPYNHGHGSFVYGTLPIFLAKALGGLAGKTGYDGTYLIGRALSGLFDLATVWIVYLLARRILPGGSRGGALVAAGFLAFAPLAIQLSHFWAVDTFLTTFSAATLLLAARHARGRSGIAGDVAMGVALGLAVACKVTGLALLAPVGVAMAIRALRQGFPREARSLFSLAGASFARLLVILLSAAIAVRIALPYAFLGPSPLSFRLDPRYLSDLKRLAALGQSLAGFPPALQWAGRTVFFPLRNFLLWGAGPFFGLAALAGALWGVIAPWKRKAWGLLILSAHALLISGYHTISMVKNIRYFYPAYPALAVLGGLALASLSARFRAKRSPAGRVLRLLPAAALAGAFLCGLAFSSIYRRPHSRVAASRWIYEHASPPARFAGEHWDDGLPLSLPGYDSSLYAGPQLKLFDPDSTAKAAELVRALERSDWIAVTSNRVYATVTRVPQVFPMSLAYYRALFEGRLGFDWVADFSSYPSLGPLVIPDDRAEETFTVYDHPRVLLFRKNKTFSAERARRIFLAAMPETPPTMHEWEKWPRERRVVAPPLLPTLRPDLAQRARRESPRELEVGSASALLLFYLSLLLLGLFALPAAHLLFPRFEDRGAGLARVLGLLITTYLLVLLVKTRLIENGRPAALLAMALLGAAGVLLFWFRRGAIGAFLRERWRLIAAGEAAFAAGFLLFTGLRAFNPEISWGEKPMDFSILNILVRTRTLPASDPWFAGVSLGYYTFGQEMVAFLTLVTGLSTRYTFNLAFGLVGGLAAAGAFSLGRNWTRRLSGGVAAASFTILAGNLSGLREWWMTRRPLDWHYFWATSRVVKNTINEYPFWSLLFADLHAHVLAMPLLIFVVACALHLVRAEEKGERFASAALLGMAAAAQALTNAWDVPLLAGFLLLVSLALLFRERRLSPRALLWAPVSLAVSSVSALLTAAPLWVRRGGAPPFGWNQEPGARGADVLTVFGLFFFLALAWWLASASERLAQAGLSKWRRVVVTFLMAGLLLLLGFLSAETLCAAGVLLFLAAALRMTQEPEDRFALGLVATSFFLILFTQRVFIVDRMNTFFKLYYEAWILFAVATAALIFRSRERPGAFARWGLAARAVFALLLAGSVFTSVTAARGALDRTTSPSAQERPRPGTDAPARRYVPPEGPTLDGLRYLRDLRPGEYRAILWLRSTVEGTPVVLEAQGPSYQDFSRVSMLTGLPTVLGWEHHVKQRGNSEAQVEARRAAIRHIYSAPEAGDVETHLRRYHVGYVYAGWLERKTYPAKGMQKFEKAKDLFELVYENPEVKIFRVAGGDSEDVLMPARETLPASGRPGEIVEVEEPPSIQETAEEERPPFSGMKEPRDAAVDEAGRVWIADFGNSRLRVFDANGGFLGGWGGRGNGTFGFNQLCAVSIREEDLYVADTWNGRIQHFSLKGEWKNAAEGHYGPRGVATDAKGRVWVTDTGNHRVILYEGNLAQIRTVGKRGSAAGELFGPVGISVGPSGSVYVADTGNRRVQVFDSEGKFERAFPVAGWVGGNEPHLEVDPEENVHVTDPEGNALLLFDASGRMLRRLTEDSAGEKFSKPTGVALNRKTRMLYVVNSGNNTVSRIPLPERKSQ